MLDLRRTLLALGLALVLATGPAMAQGTLTTAFTVGAIVTSCCTIAANSENIAMACTKRVSASVNVAASVAGDGDEPVWRQIAQAILYVHSPKMPVTVPHLATTPTVAIINF